MSIKWIRFILVVKIRCFQFNHFFFFDRSHHSDNCFSLELIDFHFSWLNSSLLHLALSFNAAGIDRFLFFQSFQLLRSLRSQSSYTALFAFLLAFLLLTVSNLWSYFLFSKYDFFVFWLAKFQQLNSLYSISSNMQSRFSLALQIFSKLILLGVFFQTTTSCMLFVQTFRTEYRALLVQK